MALIDDETYKSLRAQIDRCEAWVDTKRGKNGWASYKPEDAPDYVRAVTNDMRGAVELYELHRDKPTEFMAYTNSNGNITIWPGDPLGTFRVTREWRDAYSHRHRSIRASLPGIGEYRGQTAAENGSYVKLKKIPTVAPELPVLFRKDTRDGFNDITAVFPTLPSNYSGDEMTCYAHIGQHSGCSRGWYYTTKPAKPEEYADLLTELRQIYENPNDDPVKLVVRNRITYDMDKARMAEAALYHKTA